MLFDIWELNHFDDDDDDDNIWELKRVSKIIKLFRKKLLKKRYFLVLIALG